MGAGLRKKIEKGVGCGLDESCYTRGNILLAKRFWASTRSKKTRLIDDCFHWWHETALVVPMRSFRIHSIDRDGRPYFSMVA